jgi:glycosyltransferase involved in cell wall biosynthesis
MSDGVSIVIRAKNEAKWLASCLDAVSMQDHHDYEVIVVDNQSNDRTCDIAEAYGCRIIDITDEDFNFSRALNIGIEASSKPLIAMVSGHCVPVDDQWLTRLAMHFNDLGVVAVYGRQEPLPDTAPVDKRDLWITFGLDRKVQERDYFFHNANSMIRRTTWERTPFNENIHGVEDQDWAKKVLGDGQRIVYEPTARVFHHHGIHHSQSEERAERVVRVIELIQKDLT